MSDRAGIPDEVCIAAIETILKPLGTTLRHYMPGPKADAIEAMRGVLVAQIERDASCLEVVAAKLVERANASFNGQDQGSAIIYKSQADALLEMAKALREVEGA